MSAVRVRHRPPAFAPAALQPASHPKTARRLPNDLLVKTNIHRRPWRWPPTGLQRDRPRDRACRHTASLSSLAARKATFLLALIWIGSSVAGLLRMRVARLRSCWLTSEPLVMRFVF